ncbi:B9 domain-containing protein 1 [Eupeodes corollae]|uniref:B9 domain-containing protein 1 n=1 Tax=Eupeodes corollae TaxID=290404 RepID=UPI00249180E9|nr:B9 domain-containing protein 1 [Eupeodes corollae]
MTKTSTVAETNSLIIFCTGTIESAIFPLGPEGSQVLCRFEIVAGRNWEFISGVNKGISQGSMPKHISDKIVFNLPFECVYRSCNPFGWPQILICIYAKNVWSVETTLGYCWVHLPIIGSGAVNTSQPIRIPKDTTIMGELSTWITSKNAELKNPKVLLESYKNKDFLSMEKSGELKLSLQTLCREKN